MIKAIEEYFKSKTSIATTIWLTLFIFLLTIIFYIFFVHLWRRKKTTLPNPAEKKKEVNTIKKQKNKTAIRYIEKYTGELPEETKCVICKLAINVAQCPICESYFHFEHLQSWLQQHDKCPICQTKITVTI